MEKLEENQKRYSKIYYGTAVLHLIYIHIFTAEHYQMLSGFHFLLFVFYIFLGTAARKVKSFRKLFIECGVAMTLHTVVHQILLGPMYGYQYLYLGVVPLIFYLSYCNGKKVKQSVITCGCIFIFFSFTVMINSLMEEPPCKVSTLSGNIIVAMNMLVAFTIDIAFMVLFVTQASKDTGLLINQNHNLEFYANVDALTGLKNRRSIDGYMERAVARARGEGVDFSVLMCDIDNFKKVNDTYGHECGDMVLKNIADVLNRETRPDDVIFRWGGEEILIVISGGAYSAEKIAERCRLAVEKSEVVYKDVTVKVTITIGGASYYQGATPETLIERADKNLYKGKNSGKNQVVM